MGYSVQSLGKWTSYTPTFTGFSANPTALDITYTTVGKLCIVRFWMTLGTSNATTFTMTLPFVARSRMRNVVNSFDAGVGGAGIADCAVAGSNNILTVFKTNDGGAFTASGTKGMNGVVTYEMA